MDLASAYYLGTILFLCALFGFIVARTYRRREKERGELPKYRMMDEE